MSERPHSLELEPQLVAAFAETFISRWDRVARQVESGAYTQLEEPLTLQHVAQHLTNVHVGLPPLTLGAYALDADSQAKWLCLDADADTEWSELWRLAKWLAEIDVPTYLEPSRRGGHLWFFTPTLSGKNIRQFARQLLKLVNIPERDSENKQRIEIYPKQDRLSGGPGSLVRLPFGYHHKSGKVYHFVGLDNEPLVPTIREQVALLAKPDRVPLDFISSVLDQIEDKPVVTPPSPVPTFTKYHPSYGEPLSESLKRAISVADFVSQYVQLDGRGRGLCPFHDDQHYSFAVHCENNYWHCFAGCGGGSLIDFWMLWRAAHGQDGSFIATVTDLKTMLLLD